MTETIRTILPDAEGVARAAAELVASILEKSRGKAAICLSGGSTPKRLYQLLTMAPFRRRMPWERVHWFWGDERFVPPDHPDSNCLMVRSALLTHVPVLRHNIYPIPVVGLTPERSAAAYDKTLQTYYEAAELDPTRPLFDVTLLGLGEDGHTASLFPGVAALDERERWVAAVVGAQPEPRISLTFPALDSTRHAIFLVAGKGKHEALGRFDAGEDIPAARVHPIGTAHWLVDEAAARGA